MEEITTRFEIVRLAVKLGDFRTIDLQCEALRNLSLDEKLDEIIDLLESRNYRQALYEMKHYARSLEDDFFDTEPAPSSSSSRPQNDLGLFYLEEEPSQAVKQERVLDLDDILRYSRESQTPPTQEYVSAPDFELELPEPEPSRSTERETAVSPVMGEESTSSSSETTEETLHDALEKPELSEEPVAELSSPESDTEPEEKEPVKAAAVSREPKSAASGSPESAREKPAFAEPAPATEESSAPSGRAETAGWKSEENQRYSPIPYVGQKFRNMIHQFPPVEEAEGIPREVEAMQKKIASEGYTEEEIEAFLRHYQQYKKQGKKGEAALVLLLAAATESQFAQFLLARELFKGEVIQEDHAEAFTQINTLADQNFPEAICDLAQFYEHGVGIGKDRQLALLLYEEAAEMGVARAARHYERLKSSRGIKGLFGKVKLPNLSVKLPGKDS